MWHPALIAGLHEHRRDLLKHMAACKAIALRFFSVGLEGAERNVTGECEARDLEMLATYDQLITKAEGRA